MRDPAQQSITASEESRPTDELILLRRGSAPFPWRAAQKETWESMIQIPVSIARTLCLFQGHTDGLRPAQVEPRSATVGPSSFYRRLPKWPRAVTWCCGSLRGKLVILSFSWNRPLKDPNVPGLMYYINPMYLSNDSVSTSPVTTQVTWKSEAPCGAVLIPIEKLRQRNRKCNQRGGWSRNPRRKGRFLRGLILWGLGSPSPRV